MWCDVAASAVNHAGRSSGLTAPNGPAQTALIRSALANGHVPPEDIAFVSVHGTGTPLGDPIEISALGHGLATKRGASSRVMLGGPLPLILHLVPILLFMTAFIRKISTW